MSDQRNPRVEQTIPFDKDARKISAWLQGFVTGMQAFKPRPHEGSVEYHQGHDAGMEIRHQWERLPNAGTENPVVEGFKELVKGQLGEQIDLVRNMVIVVGDDLQVAPFDAIAQANVVIQINDECARVVKHRYDAEGTEIRMYSPRAVPWNTKELARDLALVLHEGPSGLKRGVCPHCGNRSAAHYCEPVHQARHRLADWLRNNGIEMPEDIQHMETFSPEAIEEFEAFFGYPPHTEDEL